MDINSRCLFTLLCIAGVIASPATLHAEEPAPPREYELIPISGSDGEFKDVKRGDVDLHEGIQYPNKLYAPYMYFQLPKAARKIKHPCYLNVVYRDAGLGMFDVNYNAVNGDSYRTAESGYGRLFTNQGKIRTAVFELASPDFKGGENLDTDLRLVSPDWKWPLQILSVTLKPKPTPLFLSGKPYKGPVLNTVDATSLHKKVLCGYQGWFRAPGDGTNQGWGHWSRAGDHIAPDTLSFEMWPDLSEFTAKEKYPAPGFTYPDGKPASLFSSANPRTVERHFDWMAQYGIDGVLVQRFLSGTDDPADAALVLGHARAAAERTGRVFAVEYDMSGTPTGELYPRLVNDWKWLMDEMKITDSPRYLHQDGKPVLAIWGFFADRFDGRTANRIIDFFKNDPKYHVCLIGGVNWPWRKEKDSEWARAFRRLDVISPWSVGNGYVDHGRTYAWIWEWAPDLEEAKKAGAMYMPVIHPGFSWDNLQRRPPGSTIMPRLGGEYLWRQFAAASDLGCDMAKVAMFDEVDEGTAIFKVTNSPPTLGHFVTLENKPTDWYLRLTGEGTKILHQERPNSKTIPIEP
jgi:hypothetical protein